MKKVKLGQVVKWICRPRKRTPFIAEGVVRKISISTFGSRRKAQSLQVETIGEYREVFPGRAYTTIASYNILND